MKISIIAFDDCTDLDLFFMWDLLNRVEHSDWRVQILGERCCVTSETGIRVQTHGRLEDANTSDVVLFASGRGTIHKANDEVFLSAFNLDSERQMIGSICEGALLLAALGLLEGKNATTYPTVRRELEAMGITVVEKPFVANGNVATAAGCLATQYLIGWVVEQMLGRTERERLLKLIQPVGEGLSYDDFPVPATANPTAMYAN